MKFYCGIDLSARDCHVCVIDEQLKTVVQQKLRNDLSKIVQVLEPYKANLKIVNMCSPCLRSMLPSAPRTGEREHFSRYLSGQRPSLSCRPGGDVGPHHGPGCL
jgi:hypothetical protein